MARGPQIAMLPDGKRLHLQFGPTDMIVEADGDKDEIAAAYRQVIARFRTILPELVGELPRLRQPVAEEANLHVVRRDLNELPSLRQQAKEEGPGGYDFRRESLSGEGSSRSQQGRRRGDPPTRHGLRQTQAPSPDTKRAGRFGDHRNQPPKPSILQPLACKSRKKIIGLKQWGSSQLIAKLFST